MPLRCVHTLELTRWSRMSWCNNWQQCAKRRLETSHCQLAMSGQMMHTSAAALCTASRAASTTPGLVPIAGAASAGQAALSATAPAATAAAPFESATIAAKLSVPCVAIAVKSAMRPLSCLTTPAVRPAAAVVSHAIVSIPRPAVPPATAATTSSTVMPGFTTPGHMVLVNMNVRGRLKARGAKKCGTGAAKVGQADRGADRHPKAIVLLVQKLGMPPRLGYYSVQISVPLSPVMLRM